MIQRIDITTAEASSVDLLLDAAMAQYKSPEELADDAPVLAAEFPKRVRQAMHHFRSREDDGALVVGGHALPTDPGPTPPHWSQAATGDSALRYEMLLVLYSSLLGEPFAWATQQDGRLVHDVVPAKGDENEQLGSGSSAPLMWHTEEAFHEHRADYLGLLCLRNPTRVATTIGWLPPGGLSPADQQSAFEQAFFIRPDDSHLRQRNSGDRAAFATMDRMVRQPDPVAILFGTPENPYLRVDPAYMEVASEDRRSAAVLARVADVIETTMHRVVLAPGEICFIDNYRVVHGRESFEARHDGTDRWLKRVNVTRDLRRSAADRLAGSRTIGR